MDRLNRLENFLGREFVPKIQEDEILSSPISSLINGIKNVPVAAVTAPNEKHNLYIILQTGQVHKFDIKSKVLDPDPFFDVSDIISKIDPLSESMKRFEDERGLLGFAFHPLYNRKNSRFYGEFFVSYSKRDEGIVNHISVLSRFKKGLNEKVLMEIAQPQMNHNGGTIIFGPPEEDSRNGIGYLYYGVGDGGGFNDEHGELIDATDEKSFLGNAQNNATPLGKILRIDVNDPDAYLIPIENPGHPDKPKRELNPDMTDLLPSIFAKGLRNPWKFDFDHSTGRLFICDVGQNKVEEVNLIENTQVIPNNTPFNFGWRALEGGKRLKRKNVFNATVLNYIGGYGKIVPPIMEYDHDGFSAIIGGYVYRGKKYPGLTGAYIFGDYNGKIFMGRENSPGEWKMQLIHQDSKSRLHSFARDARGELYTLRANLKESKWILSEFHVENDISKSEANKLLISLFEASESAQSDLRTDERGNSLPPKMYFSIVSKSGKIIIRSQKDAWVGSLDISRSKAFTALAFSSNENALTTRSIQTLTSPDPSDRSAGRASLQGLGASNPAFGITQFPGGIPIYKNRALIAGLGVSGDSVDVDELVAKAGLNKFSTKHPEFQSRWIKFQTSRSNK